LESQGFFEKRRLNWNKPSPFRKKKNGVNDSSVGVKNSGGQKEPKKKKKKLGVTIRTKNRKKV